MYAYVDQLQMNAFGISYPLEGTPDDDVGFCS